MVLSCAAMDGAAIAGAGSACVDFGWDKSKLPPLLTFTKFLLFNVIRSRFYGFSIILLVFEHLKCLANYSYSLP